MKKDLSRSSYNSTEVTPAVLASGSELVHQVVMSRHAVNGDDGEAEVVKLKSVLSAKITVSCRRRSTDVNDHRALIRYRATHAVLQHA